MRRGSARFGTRLAPTRTPTCPLPSLRISRTPDRPRTLRREVETPERLIRPGGFIIELGRLHAGACQAHVARAVRVLRDADGQRRALGGRRRRLELHAYRARRIAGQRWTAGATRNREVARVGAADGAANRDRKRRDVGDRGLER